MSQPKKTGPTPWHMWGNSILFDPPGTESGYSAIMSSQQLINVSYARPDSFGFLFEVRMLDSKSLVGPGPGSGGEFDIKFSLSHGIGRSQVTIDEFEHFNFTWGDGVSFPRNRQKWSTSTQAPYRLEAYGPPKTYSSLPADTNTIFAENIQVKADMFHVYSAEPTQIRVEISTLFCPRSHLRPEWFRGEISWGEDGGR